MSEQPANVNKTETANVPAAPSQTAAKPKALDPIGKTTLAITSIVAVILIALGVFLIVKDLPRNPDKTPDNSGSSGTTYAVSLGETKTVNSVAGGTYQFRLNISGSATAKYIVYLDNANLVTVKNAANTSQTFKSNASSLSFDKSYEISLAGSTSYTFAVRASDTSLKIKISRA